MSLLDFFNWCYQTDIGETIRNSSWLFPVIEAIHLVGFGVTAGAVLMVELRLLGYGLISQPVAQIAANARPWMLGGVTVMFLSGTPLFMSRVDQGLLQLRLLGEDGLPVPRAGLHLHAAQARDGHGFAGAPAKVGQVAGHHVHRAVVRGRLGWPLDRLFLDARLKTEVSHAHT